MPQGQSTGKPVKKAVKKKTVEKKTPEKEPDRKKPASKKTPGKRAARKTAGVIAPFKERINRQSIERLADRFEHCGVGSRFDRKSFVRGAARGLEELELKDRVRQVAAVLRAHLDDDYRIALEQIVTTLGDRNETTEELTGGFLDWPLLQLIEDHAADPEVPIEDHFEASMAALHELTQRFSAEFAVRPFLIRAAQKTLRQMEQFAGDENVHVRRLASEGSRPRLPWGLRLGQFIDDPALTVRILDRLVDDPELYVRKSVANHLNDISKDHPGFALEIARRWWQKKATRVQQEQRRWVVQQGLRTLVKQGHADALALLGYGPPRIELLSIEASPRQVPWNGTVAFEVRLRSTASETQSLLIDYAVHLLKADGSQRPRVFKGRTLELRPGEELSFRKRHSFRQVTTRRHYPGPQRIEVQINGEPLAAVTVHLGDSPH